MPTYDYQCTDCGRRDAVFQSISDYIANPSRPTCCDKTMERRLQVNPAMSGLANALAGDRHYDGLQATDGTPINSRTKHREYMKQKGLTMASDFKGEWAQAAAMRELRRAGKHDDGLKKEVTEAVMREVAKSEGDK